MIKKLLQGQAVEWRALGEVAEITRGVTYNKSLEVEKNGYRILRANNITVEFSKLNFDDVKQISKEAKVKDTQKLYENDILISVASGSREHVGKVAFIHEDIDFYFGGFMAVIRTKKLVNPRYIFHILKSHYFSQFLEKTFASATINNLSNSVLKEFQIPIPPLSVQSQIVQILDTFTELTAELTAELSMRRKQYQYYRDFLLSEHELAKVGFEWKRLGEVFHLKNGYTPSKSNKEYWENGTIPWFRMEDIRENGRILDYALQQVSESAVKGGKLFPANSIIMATTATIGEHALVTVNCLSNQQLTNFSIKNEFSKLLDIKFAFHYFFIIDEQAKKIANKSSMPIISLKELSKLLIPIPPLSVQSEIVAILDTFDTLVSSISEGLPKEIQLRQKQYEYYRELLLDFHPNQE